MRTARPFPESLESRELLSVTVPGVTAFEGFPFSGAVAKFLAADVKGTDYKATISWGDGQVTPGVVASDAGNLSVTGTKTYAVPGAFPVVVTVSGAPGSTAVGRGSAAVGKVDLVALGKAVVAVSGEPFTGPVASFTDSYPGLTAASYAATIDWGDGAVTAGAVSPNGLGGYDVYGAHVYDAPPVGRAVTATVTRGLDGQQAKASGTVAVVGRTNVLTGRLAPASDTGALDGITAINQPTFLGTATPYAIVTFYSRRLDQAQPVALGQAITDAAGAWNITVGALPDGAYDVAATVTPPGNQPGPLVLLTPGARLVIDTTPPVATSVRYDPGTGVVTLTLKSGPGNFDPAGLLDPAHYSLSAGGRSRAYPTAVTVGPTAQALQSGTVSVALRFDRPGRSMAGRRGAALALESITDLAGNPLSTRHLTLGPARAFRPGARRGLR